MTTINILQLIHDLNLGGMQRVVVDLCNNIDPKRFNMSVCCMEEMGPNKKLLHKKNPVYLLKKKEGIDVSLFFRFKKLFLKKKIYILHTHGINPFFYGTIGAKLAHVPVIIQTDHARGIFPVKRIEMFSEWILSKFVQKIVAVSNGVKSDLMKYEHIKPNKIDVIYNGIDPKEWNQNQNSNVKRNRENFGIGETEKVIGVCVRLTEQKGLKYLLKAFKFVKNEINNSKLIIIGDGPLRKNLENIASKNKIRKSVIFCGFRTDIPQLLPMIDVYVLPSLWEGHPLALLEAMACGKPLVASDIAGNRETVEHGKTGFLFQPRNTERLADALITILNNEKLRIRMGKQAYIKFMEKYTIENTIKLYQKLYINLCRRRDKR